MRGLSELRELAGLTPEEVADITCWSPQTLSEVEGMRWMSPEVPDAIAPTAQWAHLVADALADRVQKLEAELAVRDRALEIGARGAVSYLSDSGDVLERWLTQAREELKSDADA